MTEHDANQLRCVAHEIILRLLNAKHIEEIRLLKMHCDRAIEVLDPPPPSTFREYDIPINSDFR